MTPAEAASMPLLLLTLLLAPVSAVVTWWSSVAQLSSADMLLLGTRPLCSQLPGLSDGQARICELFMDHMPAVAEGARLSILECQHQFRDRRWNCSTSSGSDVFGPIHVHATREAAFTYSIISAGVTHKVGKGCRAGLLSSCGCSETPRPKDLKKEWTWGGCGDNIEYGYEFAKNFIDIRERERSHPKRSQEYGRSLMNRWNNEVGRKFLKRETKVTCKCHGVSGSCNLKTCWRQLPELRDTGDFLLEKYDEAVRVKINRRGNLQLVQTGQSRRRKAAKQLDLVYLEESPDYCRPDSRLGTTGTRGRVCNITSNGMDSCELLCCGRGWATVRRISREKCGCKFVWCCRVVCKMCVKRVDVHICK